MPTALIVHEDFCLGQVGARRGLAPSPVRTHQASALAALSICLDESHRRRRTCPRGMQRGWATAAAARLGHRGRPRVVCSGGGASAGAFGADACGDDKGKACDGSPARYLAEQG